MTVPLAYVLDDFLEVKLGYRLNERREILNFLLENFSGKEDIKIAHLECFLIDENLICLSQKNQINIQKVIYRCAKDKKWHFINLKNLKKLKKRTSSV